MAAECGGCTNTQTPELIICIASIKIKILSNNFSLSTMLCASCPLSSNWQYSHVNFHMIYGFGLGKVDQVRSETERDSGLGVLPKKVSQLSFWLQTDAKTVHIPPCTGASECIHSHSIWIFVYLALVVDVVVVEFHLFSSFATFTCCDQQRSLT